jgi:hypothetical protein
MLGTQEKAPPGDGAGLSAIVGQGQCPTRSCSRANTSELGRRQTAWGIIRARQRVFVLQAQQGRGRAQRAALKFHASHGSISRCFSPLTHRGARVIGADTLRFSVLLQVSSDDQEREQRSKDNPNVNAHQSSPAAALLAKGFNISA